MIHGSVRGEGGERRALRRFGQAGVSSRTVGGITPLTEKVVADLGASGHAARCGSTHASARTVCWDRVRTVVPGKWAGRGVREDWRRFWPASDRSALVTYDAERW